MEFGQISVPVSGHSMGLRVPFDHPALSPGQEVPTLLSPVRFVLGTRNALESKTPLNQ